MTSEWSFIELGGHLGGQVGVCGNGETVQQGCLTPIFLAIEVIPFILSVISRVLENLILRHSHTTA
jgi:hypothetical protein